MYQIISRYVLCAEYHVSRVTLDVRGILWLNLVTSFYLFHKYDKVEWLIIIIIIFNFYITLITNVSKRFTNILLPR